VLLISFSFELLGIVKKLKTQYDEKVENIDFILSVDFFI